MQNNDYYYYSDEENGEDKGLEPTEQKGKEQEYDADN